jgi:hypothetical protein
MTFEELSWKAKKFFLGATRGMDSFEYSSRIYNPIHGLLMWGEHMCNAIAIHEQFVLMDRDKIKDRYGALLEELSYKTDGYLIEKIVARAGIEQVLQGPFLSRYRRWRERIVSLLQGGMTSALKEKKKEVRKPVHLLPVSLTFSRFMKFSLNVWQATLDEIEYLKRIIDLEIECFVSEFG